MTDPVLGIIGGTGLYELDGLEVEEVRTVETPFGRPSSPVTIGRLEGARLLFLSRHGSGHLLPPSSINYRANVFAMKALGARWCVSVSAVGSLREELRPGDLVVPDQLIDRTVRRPSTFFEEGLAVHVPFADPYCPVLRDALISAGEAPARAAGGRLHDGATYICIEGPQFSTRAESHLYRSWGASIIGMTALPEAKLAREAEIAYATLALVTDYDCWRAHDADVDVAEILETMARNVSAAKRTLRSLVPLLVSREPSALAADALRFSIISAPDLVPRALKADLAPLIGRYLPQSG